MDPLPPLRMGGIPRHPPTGKSVFDPSFDHALKQGKGWFGLGMPTRTFVEYFPMR